MAEATQKCRIRARVKDEIEKTMPGATPEEKEVYMIRRFKEEWDKYTPGRRGRKETRSRLDIRMGYEQKPCNPVSEELVPYVGPDTPYRPEPTVEYPDEETDAQRAQLAILDDQHQQILDSVDDAEYEQALKQFWVRQYKSEIRQPFYVPPQSQEMELWRAYRYVYEEKARNNEYKLRERIE